MTEFEQRVHDYNSARSYGENPDLVCPCCGCGSDVCKDDEGFYIWCRYCGLTNGYRYETSEEAIERWLHRFSRQPSTSICEVKDKPMEQSEFPVAKVKEITPDPCPLCGGDARFEYDRSVVPPASRVRCSVCGANLWSLENKYNTIKLWNSQVYKRPAILKACPLCGVHASIRESKTFRMFSVCCDNPECGFSTREYSTADGAIEHWNSEPKYEEDDE